MAFISIIIVLLAFIASSASSFVDFVLQLLRRPSSEVKRMQVGVMKCKKELDMISAVDQFAKYARKQRELLELEKKLTATESNGAIDNFKYRILLICFVDFFVVIALVILCYGGSDMHLPELPSEWLYPFNKLVSMSLYAPESELCKIHPLFLFGVSTRVISSVLNPTSLSLSGL